MSNETSHTPEERDRRYAANLASLKQAALAPAWAEDEKRLAHASKAWAERRNMQAQAEPYTAFVEYPEPMAQQLAAAAMDQYYLLPRAAEFESAVEAGHAVNARHSADAAHQQAQRIVDELHERGSNIVELLKKRESVTREDTAEYTRWIGKKPDLYVHLNPEVTGRKPRTFAARASTMDIIEIPHHIIENLSNDSEYFKALMAHELAHQVNLDSAHHNRAEFLMRPYNHKAEVLATRMGSIIHGNVDIFRNSMRNNDTHGFSHTHPSAAQESDDLKQFSNALKKRGAANDRGEIVDLGKALDVFHASQYIAGDIDAGLSRIHQ